MMSAPVNRGWTTMRSPEERSVTTSFARLQLLSSVAPVSRLMKPDFPTSLRTSGRVTFAAAIVRPAIAASRSRAIVSVSGSSGIPLELAPCDVTAKLLSREAHALRVVAGKCSGVCHRVSGRCNCENAPSVRDQLASFTVAGGGCLKDVQPVRWGRDPDGIVLPRRIGIPVRRKNRCDGAGTRPFDRRHTGDRIAAGDSMHRLEKRALHEWKNGFGLRITEPAVELN